MTHISDLPDEILFEIYKYLEVSTIKSLQLFPIFTQSTKYYLYKHSLFILKTSDEDEEEDINKSNKKYDELPGFEISQIDALMMTHIQKFNNYQVNLSLTILDNLIKKLNLLSNKLNQLFIRDNQDFTTIKLFIQVNYSLSTFNQVEQCLKSIGRVSRYFTNNGKNIVTIDFEFKNPKQ
ncbi:hypothetical protein K4I79_005479 [Candida tropicalis]